VRPNLLLTAVVCAGVAIACGGQVVFEEPNDGGSGGTGTTGPGGTKASTGTKNTAATTNSVSSGGCSVPGGQPTDCKQACTIVYVCGQTFCGENQQLCPTFIPSDVSMDEFLVGCMDLCQNQMALIAIVDADNCDVTIGTLQGASAEFTQVCGGGF
jgi:hypothetical protein